MPRGPSPNRAWWVLPLALSLPACGAGAANDLALVRGELAKVQRDHASLSKRVEELEMREGKQVSIEKAEKADAVGSVPATTTEPKTLKVVKLEPKAVAPPPEPLPTSLPDSDDEPRPMLKLGPGGSNDTTLPDENPKSSKKITSKNPVLDPQAAKDYDAAYALVKAKKPKAALDAFGAFIVRYPDHPYAANALFWRGECYFSLGDYGAAVTQYESLTARYPASLKTADGLLKLGLAHRKLGSTAKARAAFEKLRKEFPTSEAAKKIPPEDAS
jgi:tol-pal system protein YbgF